jgi:hypothetical protein
MRLLLILLTIINISAKAQTLYSVSGKILLADSSDCDSGPCAVTMRDQTGTMVAGTFDSNLHFELYGIKSGVYKLSVDTLNVFKMLHGDTLITIDNRSIGNIVLRAVAVCEVFTKEKALHDIHADSAILIMEPGLLRFKFSRAEKNFQRKYHVSYFYSGCFRYTHYSCLKTYNKIIFDYLDNHYGAKWHKRIADNVVGYK